MLFWKQNTPGLNSKNVRILLRDSLFRFQDFLYCAQSNKICLLISIEYSPHLHAKDSLEKNLSLYSPIGAWFVISLIIWVHIEFDKPKCFSQAPLLGYVGWISWWWSLFNSRKFLLLYFEAWKYICHYLTMMLHFSFLLNFYENLLRYTGSIFIHFDSLPTKRCNDHLMLSKQS